jgi:hypothetical protein
VQAEFLLSDQWESLEIFCRAPRSEIRPRMIGRAKTKISNSLWMRLLFLEILK